MINSRRISVVLPAYMVETVLLRTVAELDREIIDGIVLVDDASRDQTVPVTRYEADSSSINLSRSIQYGIGVLRTCLDYLLSQRGLWCCEYLDFTPTSLIQLPPPARGTGAAHPSAGGSGCAPRLT